MVRRRRLYVFGVVAVLALGVASYSIAGGFDGPPKAPQSKHFKAELNGYQETPSVSSTGFGFFEATLVNDTTLHYVFQYADLEGGNSLFAHVHFGTRYVAGGVSFFLCGGSTKPAPCPNVSGTVEGDVTPADVIGPNGQGIEPGSFAEILKAMRLGDAYANIHTTRWGGGEIRGQINDKDQKEPE
jgi:CHRD domain-containing protein